MIPSADTTEFVPRSASPDAVPRNAALQSRERRITGRKVEFLEGSEKRWRPSGTCTLFVCDVVSYGDDRRTDLVQEHIRGNLYGFLRAGFEHARIPFPAVYTEDRGDGVLIAIPAEYEPANLVTGVVERLRAELGRYNALSSEAARIELRVAVHVGIAKADAHGLVGVEVNHVFRLLEEPRFKSMMKESGATVGLMLSERFYDEIVRRDTGLIVAEDYLPMPVSVKETRCSGWVRMFGGAGSGGAESGGGELQTREGAEVARSEPGFAGAEEFAFGGETAPVGLFELVECVLEIPAMLTERGRNQVVEVLPQAIAVVIPRAAEARADVYQILKTCLDYPGGLQQFVQAVQAFFGGSMAVGRVERMVARALTQL